MSEVRGEWADWLEMIERLTVTQITTRYNQGMQNTISEHTTRQTLKQMGSSSRRPHRVLLLSAKNRKRRLQFEQAHQNETIAYPSIVADCHKLSLCGPSRTPPEGTVTRVLTLELHLPQCPVPETDCCTGVPHLCNLFKLPPIRHPLRSLVSCPANISEHSSCYY